VRTASPRGQKVGPRAQVVTRERLPYLGTRGAKTACYDHIRDGMGPSEAERSRASRGSMFQTHHLSDFAIVRNSYKINIPKYLFTAKHRQTASELASRRELWIASRAKQPASWPAGGSSLWIASRAKQPASWPAGGGVRAH
jgi:hypothetical protein